MNPFFRAHWPLSQHAFAVQLVAVILLVNIFVVGLAGWSLYESRRQYEERAATLTQSFSLVLERHIRDAIEKVDVTLLALADETEWQLANGHVDGKWLNMRIERQETRLPELDALRMANKEGDIVYGTGLPSGKLASIANRDYFIRLRDTPKAGLVISRPVKGVISKQWVIMIAQRLNEPDGSFAGVIYGVITLDHFKSIFSTLDIGKNGSITLCDDQLRTIVRFPGPPASESSVGKRATTWGPQQINQAGRASGTYKVASSADNLDQIISFRKIDNYPLYIFVGSRSSDYLALWRSEVKSMSAVMACFAMVSIVSSYQIFKRRRREKLAEAELLRHRNHLEFIVEERTSELEERNTVLADEILERKRAEGELRATEEKLRALVDHAPFGIFQSTPSGQFLQVNPTMVRMYGYDTQEDMTAIADISMQIFVEPEQRSEIVSDALGSKKFVQHEVEYRRRDGSVFVANLYVRAVRGESGDVCFLEGFVEDITARKRFDLELQKYREELELRVQERTADLAKAIEEAHRETTQRLATVEELRLKERLLIQQSRLAAMGEMMGNVAHQWRQPLNLLGLIVQELSLSCKKGFFSEDLLNAQVAKAMEVIQHMSHTIDDFRTLLSPDRSKVTFSINEVVEKVLSMLQLQARVSVVAEKEVFAEGMPNEYSQVIINIIANCNDVFREREIADPRITIHIFCENGRSVVTITDNGGGIPNEIIEKIFDPYFTTKGPDRGTGIGLFMSKTIIEQSMKGILSARNTAEGAEFRLEV